MSHPAVFFLMIVAPAFSLSLALLGLETLNENRLGWFLLALGMAYPAGGVIYYFIRKGAIWTSPGSGPTVREERTDRSFWAILPGFLAALFGPPLEWYYLLAILPRTVAMEIVGGTLVVMGIGLCLWARLCLGEYTSGKIRAGAAHVLIQGGPYRFLQHPIYSGMLLVGLGVAVGYASVIGLLTVSVLLIPGLVYRISVEERVQAERFGQEFGEYQRRTKRLVPGVW
jgi:protein-S-isoprenylcysteine O-methyltransferase Ste14